MHQVVILSDLTPHRPFKHFLLLLLITFEDEIPCVNFELSSTSCFLLSYLYVSLSKFIFSFHQIFYESRVGKLDLAYSMTGVYAGCSRLWIPEQNIFYFQGILTSLHLEFLHSWKDEDQINIIVDNAYLNLCYQRVLKTPEST